MPHQGVVRKPLQQIDREEIAASGNAITAVVGQGSFLAGLRDTLVNVVGDSIRSNTLRYCDLRGLRKTLLSDFHRYSYVPRPAHTFKLRGAL